MSHVLPKMKRKKKVSKSQERLFVSLGAMARDEGRARGPRAAVVRSLHGDEDTANTLMC